MNKNDKRKDKFRPMSREDFNKCVSFSLINGDRMVSYCMIKNGIFCGGMADTFKEALDWCKQFYEEDKDIDLSIGDFSEGTAIWRTPDILHEIGVISDDEYDEYIDNLELDD